MITAISGAKQNVTNAKLKCAKAVAFTGIPTNLLKNEGTISKLTDETINSISKIFKKLLGKYELPYSKKPLTANADLTHVLPDGTPISIPMPEVHTTTTQILDGANILKPDAADLAANTADALSTKAALADIMSGTSHASDALVNGLDAKAGIVDAIANGADAITAKAAIVDSSQNIIHGIIEAIDKIV